MTRGRDAQQGTRVPRRSLGINSGALTDSFPRCFHLSVGSSPTSGAPRAHFVSRELLTFAQGDVLGGRGGRQTLCPQPGPFCPPALCGHPPSAASSPSREMPVATAPQASPWLLLARIKWLVKPSPHLPTTLCPRASFFISWKPRKEQGEFKTPWTPFSGKPENRSRAQTEGRGQPPAGKGPPPGAPRGAGGSPETQQPLHRLPHRAWEPGRRLDRPSGGQVTPRAAFPS